MMKKLLIFMSVCLCLTSGSAVFAAESSVSQSYHKKNGFYYDFSGGYQGWSVDFADLPIDYMDNDYRLQHKVGIIPLPGKRPQKGLFVSGMNRSDDLFMYISRKLVGGKRIQPNTRYQAVLEFDLATNVPKGMVGIGGSPGESVFVKAGIVNQRPIPQVKDSYYRLNLDKGNQAEGGNDLKVLGTIEKTRTVDDSYELKHFRQTFDAVSNEKGELYVIIGTDSGYEGLTSIYYTNISLKLKNNR